MMITALLAAEAPPAGGTATGEVIASAAVASVAIAIIVAVGIAHRRRGLLQPIAAFFERHTGLPSWSTIPVGIAGVSLLIAVWGYYWDVSWHIDRGRDAGAFANPAHWFILIGLDGIALAAIVAFFLGADRSATSVRITDRWSVPAGAVLLGSCGLIAVAGFPLDDIWHRLFGQDVTAWGPTHIQMIGGASLATLGCWALTIEGRRAATGELTRWGKAICRSADLSLAGAFLIGLSTLQVEFDFGVPQFRQVEQPVLIALAAGIGLVTARIRIGRGGALAAVAFFIVVRGALALAIDGLGRTTPHFPLYIAEALIVEAVALVIPRNRQFTLGLVAGFGIGTIGFGAEWAWSHAWMKLPWSTDMLPEGLLLAALAGTAGGLLGGFAGRAVSLDVEHQRTPRGAAIFAWTGAVAALAIALPMTANRDWRADIQLDEVAAATPGAPRSADIAVRLDPPSAADGATWFNVLWWQGSHDGNDGGSSMTELVEQPDGSYRTESPVPIDGTGKTLLRLHRGNSMQAVPIYLPADPAIPADAVLADDGSRTFQADKRILQREARTDNVNLERAAYVALALVAALWMAVISWALARLERPTRRAQRSS
jgi:hypothetical protein